MMDELTEWQYKQICEYTIWLDMVVLEWKSYSLQKQSFWLRVGHHRQINHFYFIYLSLSLHLDSVVVLIFRSRNTRNLPIFMVYVGGSVTNHLDKVSERIIYDSRFCGKINKNFFRSKSITNFQSPLW